MDYEFDVNDFLKQQIGVKENETDLAGFEQVCSIVKRELDRMTGTDNLNEKDLERQRQALLGMEQEVQFYKEQIKGILAKMHLNDVAYPSWYPTLVDGIFSEILGFAGILNWIIGETDELRESSSCKILGDRIYYLIGGEMVLQPQRISLERRKQLKEALLLVDTTKSRTEAYFEVYLKNGSRVTIYNDDGIAKEGQDCIVLRKYHVNTYTFEEQSARGTIPAYAVDLFKAMVRVGFNVAFTGPVRSAKTTFLTTWQSYEDPRFEGVMIESDPEIPLHEIMPEAPIMQLVPDDRYRDMVISTAKRSDAKYVILGEARDGKMLNLAIEAANMGTRRSKVTFHNSESVDFCYDVAEKISRDCGGNLMANMIKVSKSFHYVFNFFSLHQDQGKKRLKGIWEIRFDPKEIKITMHQVCKYVVESDQWVWNYDIGDDKREFAKEEDYNAFQVFDRELKRCAEKYPNMEDCVFESPYMKFYAKEG